MQVQEMCRVPCNHWSQVTAALTSSSRPGTFSVEDLDRYREAWAQPGAYTAMLNWYRAALQHPPPPPVDPRIHLPTEIIWGVHDRFIGFEFAVQSLTYCDQGRLAPVPDATHWVIHEQSQFVNERILHVLDGYRQ
jgi:epoxide hydrolase 4